ncbi:hypothetical protein ATL39_0166 [Sinobaca qinghaiensis]|uniref:Branched-chain amino acid ABC transporter substrate-binding protein n=1 Tax=Sinobaca qinghaiensis TaxID=342944 RepID=A0A419V786_9BACL|nr:hypothetical protein [Sinobaca qinghaiensis]RKD75956.1 hypothetical protein ATL39_0166 [Sinobaca qinghaiensis]
MKKITDERLVLQNLKNIRMAFIIQTIGVLAILGYEFIVDGMEGMRENPLWLVFMVTSISLAYLSMRVSVDHENNKKSPKRSLYIGLTVVTIISITAGILIPFTEGSTVMSGIIIGGVIFVCSIVPVMYTYHLRKSREET